MNKTKTEAKTTIETEPTIETETMTEAERELSSKIERTEEWNLLRTLAQAEVDNDLEIEDETTSMAKGSIWLTKIIEFMLQNGYKATEKQLIELHPNPKPTATAYNLRNSLASVRSKGKKKGEANIVLIGSTYHLKWFKWDNMVYVVRNGQLIRKG